jgi:periplasmic divalent cation tolerance protein
VERRLAACVNILPGVTSLFRWAGKVDQAREALLMIKTPAHLFPRLRRAVLRVHPYDLPEAIAVPIVAGYPAYLRWVRDSVRGPRVKRLHTRRIA